MCVAHIMMSDRKMKYCQFFNVKYLTLFDVYLWLHRPALRVRIVENTSRLDVRTFLCINVLCRVTIKSRVWINRVKLPILLAVS